VRKHLTYANVVATLCLVLVLGGGAAYAANTVFSTDIVNGEVKTVDLANRAVTMAKLALDSVDSDAVADDSLGSRDLRNNAAVQSPDVRNESLTGADIADQSGVDTCAHGTQRLGEMCVYGTNVNQVWNLAGQLCSSLELRLPSYGEAASLARNHDLPNVDETELFWTETVDRDSGAFGVATFADGGGGNGFVSPASDIPDTVCVTTPTN